MSSRLRAALFAPVDTASLIAFRVGFGLLMLGATLRFVANGWVREHFLEPTFFFPYWGLGWIRPGPAWAMYGLYAVMGLAALCVALGLLYRASALLFFVTFTWAHFIDKTHWLNHYWLVTLVALLMGVLPLGRAGSIDVHLWPARRLESFPTWCLWLLRFQFAVVYFFGGVAKLSHDWLVHAQPLTIWLGAHGDFPLLGGWLVKKSFAYAMSWLGAAFDLSVVFLLLGRRTRPFAYAAALGFHVMTSLLFQLGMFPSIMLFGALLFFPPAWPRRLFARWLPPPPPPRPATGHEPANRVRGGPGTSHERRVMLALGAWALVQVLLPLRHHLYPGPLGWREEGFRFAWNVMLVEKNGSVDFVATEPSTGRRWVIAPEQYLTRYQAKMMATQPDMILQLAHRVAADLEARGARDVEVRADAHVAWNGRPSAVFVDPHTDLAQERDTLAPKRWIAPAPTAPPRL
ncbi:MAG: HTTM domain-containing protein [Polyangiaceae bacterium]